MKKLISLLSVLTISGTAIPTTIAASPYQKEETIKNNDINYQQANNLENLNRNKRANNYAKCIGVTAGAAAGTQALVGVASGAAIGSVVPGLGTAIGAGIGALVGAFGGGAFGGGAAAVGCKNKDTYLNELNINNDLGIIDDNDNSTILNKLKEKNPVLNIDGLIVDKKYEDDSKKIFQLKFLLLLQVFIKQIVR